MKLMKEALHLLEDVSGDRLRHELDLIFSEPNPITVLQRADHLGLLAAINPDLKWTPQDSLWAADLLSSAPPSQWNLAEKIKNTPISLFAFYLIWFHRVSSIRGLEITKRLCFNKAFEDALEKFRGLIPFLARLPHMKPSQVYKTLSGIPDFVIYSAYHLSSSNETREVLQNYIITWRFVNPTISGKVLETYKIRPGPIYRDIIDQLRDAWLDGLVTTPSEELQLFHRISKGYLSPENK
jgi:tRNA nucleotidyltransferase (CCA-adding enzyme)